jgi:heterodisulfide reductase subunit A-like polyferredoxin
MLNLEWLNLQQLVIIVLVIAIAKLYFRGSNCKIRRDLTGKVAVITGGNTGIGKETMLDLARNGCTVIMGARDRLKSEEAVKSVIK